MKKLFLLFTIIATLFASCLKTEDAYKEFTKDIKYRYIQIGEEESIKKGNTILLNLCITDTLGDTIHYVPDFPYLKKVESHPIDSLLRRFTVGDSVSIRLNSQILLTYIDLYKLQEFGEGEVSLNIKIIESIKKELSKERVLALLSLKEIKEQEKLNKYLNQQGDSLEYIEGVYRKINNETSGIPLHFGDQVTIEYKGSFLNGYVFDSTEDKELTPTFTFGKDLQLLDGIQKALIGLKEGETVKIILPSRHAFGERGSLAGIVPPYTTVIFDIKILKVSN